MNLILNKPEYCNNDDRICVQLLLAEILRRGYNVSVHDGEDWPLNCSSNLHEILDNLATSGEDMIEVRDKAYERVGKFYMIYCNGSEGDPLICLSDYSANKICEDIYTAIETVLSEVVSMGHKDIFQSYYKNPINLPTLEEFSGLCNNHDWTYSYSDDHYVYKRGSVERDILLEIVEQGGAGYAKVYNIMSQARLPSYE